MNGFWLNDEVRKAVTSPIIGKIAAKLMKTSSVYLWHDQVIYKPGTAGQPTTNVANVGSHQDYGYWKASFHHSLTFHGSGPNTSDQPRLCVIAHMFPGGTVYRKAANQWHPNVVFLGPNVYDGQPFQGDYWPRLWPQDQK